MTRRVTRSAVLSIATAIALVLAGVSITRAADPPLRCTALVTKVNALRTSADLRLMNALCQIGKERTARFAKYDRAWHNAGWAGDRLQALLPGLCWTNIGEAIGQTDRPLVYASLYAERFAALWYASDHHWPMLNASRYTRAGGYMARSSDGTMFTAFYVLDTC